MGASKSNSSSTGVIASTVDLLAHEYGWSKDHILSLSLLQLRRILRALSERKRIKAEAYRENIQISPVTGEEVATSPKRGQIFDLGTDFEAAMFQGKKSGLSIKDR